MKTKEPISVNGAQITTVTVDIQVIRIGSKQMTVAVFRQLVYEDIFNQDGTLRALPWGYVNYDHSARNTVWFVYSYEGILYRCDLNLQQNRKLAVRSDFKGWFLEAPSLVGEYVLLIGPFGSESEARKHLNNRLESIAVLEAAPQLFIAV